MQVSAVEQERPTVAGLARSTKSRRAGEEYKEYDWKVSKTPTDDEVVHSKHLGYCKEVVDLYQSYPLIVIWDALVGQKFKHF